MFWQSLLDKCMYRMIFISNYYIIVNWNKLTTSFSTDDVWFHCFLPVLVKFVCRIFHRQKLTETSTLLIRWRFQPNKQLIRIVRILNRCGWCNWLERSENEVFVLMMFFSLPNFLSVKLIDLWDCTLDSRYTHVSRYCFCKLSCSL